MIAYAVASAADGKKYKAADGHEERYKKDIDAYCKDKGLPPEVETLYVPEPVEFALHSCKLMLQNGIFGAFEQEGIDKYEIYLTGSGNFREQVARIMPYKGNRNNLHKPFHLQNCRAYLGEWGAKIIDGMEADDAIGIEQYNSPIGTSCICSLDKDLNMLAGNHFNWGKQEKYFVSELDAMRNFYQQMLTGDTTDNILGLYGVGKDSTLVKKIHTLKTPEEMADLVIGEYKRRFGSYWGVFFAEHYELLWILREEL